MSEALFWRMEAERHSVKTEKCCANIHDDCACPEGCGCTCYSCECWEVPRDAPPAP
jgi:hypothetical protein